MNATKIVVLDDDPTGSQTVHSCLLLTCWNVETLRQALTDTSPLFFVLTNTRSMTAEMAAAVTREVCANVKAALDKSGIKPIFVSRSDSTLRGHYPVEPDLINDAVGPFDATFLIPAFVEAGRITRDSVHYQRVGNVDTPVHKTEFARDPVFGYTHSFLPDYVEEKTKGRIKASDVERFLLADIDRGSLGRLMGLAGNTCCVVDAENQQDLNRFAEDVLEAVRRGKRFLFRSAASILTALAGLPPQPVSPEHMGCYVRNGKPGAIIVGSYVQKTTEQVTVVLEAPNMAPVEVDVNQLPAGRERLLACVRREAEIAHKAGKTPVIYTSRAERSLGDQREQLNFGEIISSLLVDITRLLPESLGFLVTKGGITSHDVLSQGLGLRASRVLGQILPGCSVVQCPADHPRFAHMPVVIFPGNVGDETALKVVFDRLSASSARP